MLAPRLLPFPQDAVKHVDHTAVTTKNINAQIDQVRALEEGKKTGTN